MKLAEQVTFGASGLDRAAHLRGQTETMAKLRTTGKVLLVWRGKPLFSAASGGLAWLPATHAVLGDDRPLLFLGQYPAAGCGVFAADLSTWEPAAGNGVEAAFLDASRQRHPDLSDEMGFEDLRGRMTELSPQEAELAATARALLHWHQSHGFCAACGAASVMEQAGWQRRCPACGAQHFPRTDPVVIMLITDGNRVLLGRNAAWPEGMYSLLAGFVEPGETIENAVRREVFEESGVTVDAVHYLTSQPWPFPASLMLGCRAEARSQTITIDPTELQDALWLSRQELVQVFAGVHPAIKPPRKGAVAEFLMRNWLADRLE